MTKHFSVMPTNPNRSTRPNHQPDRNSGSKRLFVELANSQLECDNDRLEGKAVAHDAEITLVPSLRARLCALRAQFSALGTALGAWYEEQGEVISRPEQVDAALQRLEWAVDRTNLDQRKSD